MAKLQIVEYFRESYDELIKKVSWPSWSELQGSAIVVSVASLILALMVYVMDQSFHFILQQIYKNF